MIDLIFWSFAVALLPIALSAGSTLLAIAAGPFSPPDDHPFRHDRHGRPVPHFLCTQVGRSRGYGHGR